jgi:hypothetical protein
MRHARTTEETDIYGAVTSHFELTQKAFDDPEAWLAVRTT